MSIDTDSAGPLITIFEGDATGGNEASSVSPIVVVPTPKGKANNKPVVVRGHMKRIKIVSHSTPSSYWRNTFALTTSPLILSGFPSYILLKDSPAQINSVRKWVRHLFDFRRLSLPLTTLTCVLLVYTLCLHLVLLKRLAQLFESLFILGEYGSRVVVRVGLVVLQLTQVTALNYVWVYGFKIKQLIDTLDQKHGRHSEIRCGYRTSLVILMVILVGHMIAKYGVASKADIDEDLAQHCFELLISFSNHIFFAFAFPVYCTFCFGIRFELLIIKAYLYDQIAKRITPNVRHLNKIKIWFTQAADHIVYVNSLYWCLFAVVIAIWLWEIFDDAETLTKVVRTQFAILVEYALHHTTGSGEDSFKTNKTQVLSEARRKLMDPECAKEVYVDIVWVTIACSIMFYTIWQAVVTNDAVKHVQNWLNDFASGGGGSDVAGILNELRVVPRKKKRATEEIDDDDLKGVEVVRKESVTVDLLANGGGDYDGELQYESESEVPLLWTGQKVGSDGEDYEEMFYKVNHLRNYIAVRIKLENPALLSIMVFGLGRIIPFLNERLQGYKL